MVQDGPPSNIYRVLKKRNMKGAAKDLFKYIQTEYRTLPFASRWVLTKFPGEKGEAAFEELLKTKCIASYPQLLERTRAKVAQAEHTVIVTSNGCEVTTA
jgi:methionyl aminopeptidase